MLATQIALHDVLDVEGFVRATIARSRIRLEIEEREELVAEGICILYDLAARYEPHRNGYETNGCFSGFAAQFLPRRLGDVWHARHPEHVYTTADNGKRAWRYGPAPVTLDDDERPVVIAVEEAPAEQLVREAIARLEPWERIGAYRVLDLLDEGYSWNEVARALDLPRSEAQRLCERVGEELRAIAEET